MNFTLFELFIKPVSVGIFVALALYPIATKREDRPDAVPARTGAVAVGPVAALGLFAFNFWELG